jgi:hypothetical protein
MGNLVQPSPNIPSLDPPKHGHGLGLGQSFRPERRARPAPLICAVC